MLIPIETHQGIPVALNLETGHFEAQVPSGLLRTERLLFLRRCIQQALLIEREIHLAKNGGAYDVQ